VGDGAGAGAEGAGAGAGTGVGVDGTVSPPAGVATSRLPGAMERSSRGLIGRNKVRIRHLELPHQRIEPESRDRGSDARCALG
jgi:hypothetical protein